MTLSRSCSIRAIAALISGGSCAKNSFSVLVHDLGGSMVCIRKSSFRGAEHDTGLGIASLSWSFWTASTVAIMRSAGTPALASTLMNPATELGIAGHHRTPTLLQ